MSKKMSIFRLLWIGAILVISSCGIGDKYRPTINTPYTFQDVHHVLDAQIMQWNAGSVDGFMQGYWNSDSLLFITAKGPRYGYQAVSDSYKKNYPSKEAMGNLRFEVIKMQWIDQVAGISQVLGKWHVAENGKPQSGYFSLIFKNIHSQPKIVIDHTW
jgi:hypothetical protein